MKKICVFILVTMMSLGALAQDVITKANGEEIRAIVQEIGKTEITYKKANNPNGPNYVIDRNEVYSITYKNGDRDIINANANAAPQPTQPAQQPQNKGRQAYYGDSQASFNAIYKFNQENDISFIGKLDKKAKIAEAILCVLKVSESSQMADKNIEIAIGSDSGTKLDNNRIEVTVINNSDKTIFIDRGTSFFVRNGNSVPYYTPSVSSEMSGESGSAGFSVPIPGLGGMAVGGGTSSATHTTTYAQRILAVPAHSRTLVGSAIVFPSKSTDIYGRGIGCYSTTYSKQAYNTGYIILTDRDALRVGEQRILNEQGNPFNFGIVINYAFDEQLTSTANLSSTLYVGKMIGVKKGSSDKIKDKQFSTSDLDFVKSFNMLQNVEK